MGTTLRVALCCCVLLAGCTYAFDIPNETHEITPPDIYREWYAQTSACVGIDRGFDRIVWYAVPGARWYHSGRDVYVIGLWVKPNEIFLAQELLMDRRLVKNEMIHYLTDSVDHPEALFDACVR